MNFLKRIFGWFFVTNSQHRPPKKLPPRVLAPIAEIVEQGLLVADVAIKMAVKNDIIVNALKHKADYKVAEVEQLVRHAVNDLIAEREMDAANIEHMRNQIQRSGYTVGSDTEYGLEDSRTLKHRQEVYDGVAAELRRRAADPEYLKDMAAKAHALAWSEVGESIAERATHPYYSGGDSAEYRAARKERIEELIQKDLKLLEARANPVQAAAEKSGWLAKFFAKKNAN